MTLVYVKAELLEVEFARAQQSLPTKKNILTDEILSHVPDGNFFVPPFRGWQKVGSQINNFPVAHTFTGESPLLHVTVRITPPGMPFLIEGAGLPGRDGSLKWKRENQSSTGMAQELDMTPADGGMLIASAGITVGSISWLIKTKPCPLAPPLTLFTEPGCSGPHEIFRVFGKINPVSPVMNHPVPPSVCRMRTVCGMAEGKTTEMAATEALHVG